MYRAPLKDELSRMLILEAESIEAGPSFTVFFETMFFKQHTATHSYSEAGVSAQKKKTTPKKPKNTQRSNWTADRSSLLEVVTADHRKC